MLQKDKVTLRPVTMADKPQLAAMANNYNIWKNLRDAMPYPYTEAHAASFINMILEGGKEIRFAMEFEGQFCGMIGLHPQDDIYSQSVEIGYWVGEPFWGKGIGTSAVGLMTDLAFEKGYIRVFAGVFDNNPGSQRILEKNGYLYEGTFKHALTKAGVVHDEIRLAKTKVK